LALRTGRRIPGRLVVVHVAQTDGPDAPRAGLAVSKAVGGSVVRNRVARRLRHLLRARVSALPTGSLLVVRALPPAAAASSLELGAALDRALSRYAPAVLQP
jgi:ribonuclease P protein component